jgi:hypothetical protein
MSVEESDRKALTSFRIQGDLVRKDKDRVLVRRGGSLFEISMKDVLKVKELEGEAVEVVVSSEAELFRTSLVRAGWAGAAIGFRPVFSDCTDCCDCNGPTECSRCTDCTECSYCTEPIGFSDPRINLGSVFVRRFVRQQR